ncbi:MAG: efflux RND transporter periplasmic adaptor subunit [Firmicutes bacterium]|nr:efflux RND transporter periplasmic adaptor subunit [Bacillota bacterium]
MSRRIISAVVVALILIAGGRAAYSRLLSGGAEKESRPVYSTARVVRGNIRVAVEGTGQLQPIYLSNLESPADGTIEEMLVDRGQRVEEGQVVARLRNDEIAYEVADLEFQLERARLELSSVLDVPKSEVTKVNPGMGVQIKAPISGRVTSLEVKVGDAVAEGTLIARIVDDSAVISVAELVSTEIPGVARGQPVTMRFDEFSGSIRGWISDVDLTPVPKGEGFVYRVTIEADNPGLVKLGQEFRATVHTPRGDVAVGSVLRVDRYRRETIVSSLAEGTVTSVDVRNMSLVKPGQTIVTLGGEETKRYVEKKQLDIRELEVKIAKKQEIRDKLVVVSPIAGVVAWVRGGAGTYVRAGEPLGNIFDNSKMNLMIRVDELDVVHLRDGQEATVSVEALPGRRFKGVVLRVDMMGQTEGGFAQYGVFLEVEGTDVLKPGMTANVEIFVAEKRDVLLVPVEAVFEQDDRASVEVLHGGNLRVVPVELGLVNDEVAEVVSGVEEGWTVVTGSSLDRLDRALEEERDGEEDGEPLILPAKGRGGSGGRTGRVETP